MITLVEDTKDPTVKRVFKTKSHAAGIKHVVGERYTSRTLSAEEAIELTTGKNALPVEDITDSDDDAIVSADEKPAADPNANITTSSAKDAGASFNG